MKKLLIATLFTVISNSLLANTVVVEGNNARSIMEALATSGFKVGNSIGEWGGKTITIQTEAISCHYSAVSPDDWMTNISCHKGLDNNPMEPNLYSALALAKSLYNYADQDAGLGNRWLTVNSIDCSLVYDQRTYTCKLDVNK